MKTSRWLLPFTHEVDMLAIEYAVRLAGNAGATLVSVSLISTPSSGARLEHIQQSKDFLEAVLYKAERLHVPLERDEVFTTDVQQCLVRLVHEKHCDGIVLVTGSGRTRLLQDHEVKQLLINPPAALVIIRLSAPNGLVADQGFWRRLFARLRGSHLQRETALQPQEQKEQRDEQEHVTEEPQWVRTEKHSIG